MKASTVIPLFPWITADASDFSVIVCYLGIAEDKQPAGRAAPQSQESICNPRFLLMSILVLNFLYFNYGVIMP